MIVRAIRENTNLRAKDAAVLADLVIAEMIKTVQQGSMKISGLGSFSVVNRTPERRTVSFVVSPALLSSLNSKGEGLK